MPEGYNEELVKVISYMKAHWPSKVKEEWQVSLEEYPEILKTVINDFALNATKNRHLIRITGISGSGKTTQILPAVESYCEKKQFRPVLVAARRFVKYHPHCEEIKNFYGEENLRKNTDEFSTIMMFLTIAELIKNGYDIILDVALLDPKMEGILLKFLTASNYEILMLMIAVSTKVTEHFLSDRAWRHSKETEEEFVRATRKALEFYAVAAPDTRIILWSVYDKDPIYDGEVKGCIEVFVNYSKREELPASDDDARREAKTNYLLENLN